jgi:hypothetical protein
MFEIAGVRLMRRASSALCVISLAALLGACTHPSPPSTSEPKSWVVENVAGKSTAELYADVIAPAVFERSGSQVIDGYTVESGNLLMPDKSVGSLVTVRSGDGSLTAFVQRAGKNGLLLVNSKGESRFTPDSDHAYLKPDTVSNIKGEKSEALKSTVTAGPYVIDMLIGYSNAAVVMAGGDATANALAQVESVNLALRNSLVSDVSMKLVGVQIIGQNYSMTEETLLQLPDIFSVGMQTYDPDMLFGVFAPHPDDSAAGWGYMPGNLAIGHVSDGWVFRHEIGHNAGGNHCHEPGGSYNYGFDNGKSGTIQCGENTAYYSVPSLQDEYGLPRGNAVTADMARVWRENAVRLSSYAHFVPKASGLKIIWTDHSRIKFGWDLSPRAVKYEVWVRDGILLPPKKLGESLTAEYVRENVSSGLRPYYVVAVYSDGTKSPQSNVVHAKPYEAGANKSQ